MENYITKYISLADFITLGGIPVAGMKLRTNPDYPSLKKDFIFIELIPGKGVKLEGQDNLFGTGWIYTEQKLQLHMPKNKFKEGDTVIYKNKAYDYGYESGTGNAVIYEPGCRNMQDAISVPHDQLTLKE